MIVMLVGVALVSITVAENVPPLMALEGVTVIELSSDTPTRRVACRVTPLRLAVMVAVALLALAEVVMGKVADEAASATVTDWGTVAAAVLDESATAVFVAAVPVKVTVPVDVPPAGTEAGETVIVASCGGRTVNTTDAAY